VFADRVDAGRRLAHLVRGERGPQTVVLGLPRGGVPVAAEVARALGAPLDVIVVRKLGVPIQPELAMGALGENDVLVIDETVLRTTRVGAGAFDAVVTHERAELVRRAAVYRRVREPLELAGRTVIIVDDGIATGSTARAACAVARARGAARVVLAAPVAARASIRALADVADEVVCVQTPPSFFAIGEWYDDFSPTSDREVLGLLTDARAGTGAAGSEDGSTPPPPRARDEDVEVRTADAVLPGRLTVPPGTTGIVVFVHGSGSSRRSPRNQVIATHLNASGLSTLLFDLLTADEEPDRRNVFDIDLLGTRLADATRWLRGISGFGGLPTGFFGASTGAGAALWAAAEVPVDAVVSRGGRPDLAADRLGRVRAPTLLIVGGRDETVLSLNRTALADLGGEGRLEVVPGATHLFEEAGALERVAGSAGAWFTAHLVAHTS
jgi:putative phosphoribosyl transferase